MNEKQKEQILKAAQSEQYKGKELENYISDRGILFSELITFLVGIVLFSVEYFVKRTVNTGFIAIGMTAVCVLMLYEGIRRKQIWKIVFGAIAAVIALFMAVGYIIQVIA